jgi:hypothetical protein
LISLATGTENTAERIAINQTDPRQDDGSKSKPTTGLKFLSKAKKDHEN